MSYFYICLFKTQNYMKEITLRVPDSKYPFFMELVHNLGFVKSQDDGDTKEEIIANLKQGFREMKLYKEGKLKGTPLNDLLDEL